MAIKFSEGLKKTILDQGIPDDNTLVVIHKSELRDEDKYEFRKFGKIPRLSRDIVVTEKIDGTNAQVYIRKLTPSEIQTEPVSEYGIWAPLDGELYEILAGSRTRWLFPNKEGDNFGFASWVFDNADQLVKLGPGRHYGEWWGQGIQRGYGLKERRFSLFNTGRWAEVGQQPREGQSYPPECCHVVPWIGSGPFNSTAIDRCMMMLKDNGSFAAPGYMRPEGIVVYHTGGQLYFKKTFEHDDEGKGK